MSAANSTAPSTFSTDANNPLDTNYSFANAALGTFDSYTESNARYGANERQAITEWFVQDAWKVTKRLTLDYGMRWTWANQMYPNNPGQQSALALGLYSASQAPAFYVPVLANGVRMAENPLSGSLLPQAFVGDLRAGKRESSARWHLIRRYQLSAGFHRSTARALGTAPRFRLGCIRKWQDRSARRYGDSL